MQPMTMNVRLGQKTMPLLSAPKPRASVIAHAVDGLVHLSEAAQLRTKDKKANKFEKVKAEKCGSNMWTEVQDLATLIREGKTKWEDLNLDDVDIRLKWAGLFHRGKRTPGKFMMRLRVANGVLSAKQLRVLGECIAPYGADGCADITTRANIQLRGVTITEADTILNNLMAVGITGVMSGMDNVRNLTGNPIAGVDPHELIDTIPLCQEIQDAITDFGKGRADLTNLPRKINICVSSTRDDFPHTHINDLGFQAALAPGGEVVFNVELGGYFSIKRNIMSIPMGYSVTREQLTPFCIALLQVFRDHGPRTDRQKTRLIWLIEEVGVEKFKDLIEEYMGNGAKLAKAVHTEYTDVWERRNLMGVHAQKQPGMKFVGCSVPAGRLHASDFGELARLAETYGDGTIRITCEENVIFANVPEAMVAGLTSEPLLVEKFKFNPGKLEAGMVSCTGSQFCGFGLVETKNRAMAVVKQLEEELDLPKIVRMHWTGCPNSCGQAQVGDIGLMGAPAKLDGKATEGVKLFLGGKIGENPALATAFGVGIPVAHLLPRLREILINDFGATLKDGVDVEVGLPPVIAPVRTPVVAAAAVMSIPTTEPAHNAAAPVASPVAVSVPSPVAAPALGEQEQ
jgi:ferredoxin-nitrite reductase